MSLLRLVGMLALASTSRAYVPRVRHAHLHLHPSPAATAVAAVARSDKLTPEMVIAARQSEDDSESDPSDFSWVKRWAAIGDSYTAGIGAGSALGDMLTEELTISLPDGTISGHGDWYCARYDMSYPMIIDRLLGGQVDNFQYFACSGDRSQQIYQQAQQLNGDLDLVVMTAGGNDLCLAGIIQSCILLSSRAYDECETVIAKAEENVDNIIKDNVKEILYALKDKVNDDGIVVVNGYAQFFNTDSEDCANQAWDFFWYLSAVRSPEKLTIARRQRFNKLVTSINSKIAEAVQEIADDDDVKYRVGFADWDAWVYEGVDGQMCSTSSNGNYPDENQQDMQFIKPDTWPWDGWEHDELRKRQQNFTAEEIGAFEETRERLVKTYTFGDEIYESALYKSANPAGAAVARLEGRDPSAPGCPGDEKWDYTFGLGLPNKIGANFHPNENGHTTIASYALAEVMDLRSLVIGKESPACDIQQDEFKCWSADDSKAYAMADRLDKHYEQFCKDVEQPEHTTGWTFTKSYDEGTPEEHSFVVDMSEEAGDFDQDECVESMRALIHSCDTSSTSDMNWKFGGKYVRGEHTYYVNIKRTNRPWPPPDTTYGACEGWYKFLWGSYTVSGAGFSTWDWGQDTLRPQMDSCYGYGTTNWKFEYHDEPTDEGYEWKATFRTPIWVRARCWKNNKIVKAVGGWTDGCKGND